MMNIPFSINGFPIGTVSLFINDSGNGINISNCEIILFKDQNQNNYNPLKELLTSLNLTPTLMTLSVEEINAIMTRLEEIKLLKI